MILRKNIKFITADGSASAAGKKIAFISYRHKDKRYLQEAIKILLRYTDYAIWYDENLTVGEKYDTEIIEAMTISHVFIILVTPHYFEQESYSMQKELPFAREMGLIPAAILCEDITQEQMDILKSWTNYVYDLTSNSIEGLRNIEVSDSKEEKNRTEVDDILRKVNCSYLTVAEMDCLVNNMSYVKDVIDPDILRKYDMLLSHLIN